MEGEVMSATRATDQKEPRSPKPAGNGSHKDSAIEFLKMASSGRVREAYRDYVGQGFRHHNPYFPGDAASLMEAMEENASQNPEKTFEVHQALEDGNLVAIHGKVRHKPADLGTALIHIFRFESDRIVELWDLGQEVPEESPNKNGMF
jgi:predicted SnoaL-like aldol condensation-catalyzing enzyme